MPNAALKMQLGSLIGINETLLGEVDRITNQKKRQFGMNELLRQRWWIDGILRGLPPAGLDRLAEKHARAGTTPHGYLYPELLEATDMP